MEHADGVDAEYQAALSDWQRALGRLEGLMDLREDPRRPFAVPHEDDHELLRALEHEIETRDRVHLALARLSRDREGA